MYWGECLDPWQRLKLVSDQDPLTFCTVVTSGTSLALVRHNSRRHTKKSDVYTHYSHEVTHVYMLPP